MSSPVTEEEYRNILLDLGALKFSVERVLEHGKKYDTYFEKVFNRFNEQDTKIHTVEVTCLERLERYQNDLDKKIDKLLLLSLGALLTFVSGIILMLVKGAHF